MKKKIAKLLMRWALKLDHTLKYSSIPEAKRMGIRIHISKNDVRKYRKENPSFSSHRKALNQMIEDARWRVAGSIGKGLMQHGAINYRISRTPYVADVEGDIFVYGIKSGEADEQQ